MARFLATSIDCRAAARQHDFVGCVLPLLFGGVPSLGWLSWASASTNGIELFEESQDR